jgi:hypothetical protein
MILGDHYHYYRVSKDWLLGSTEQLKKKYPRGLSLYYVRQQWVDGFRQMVIFADVQYCSCWVKVGGWVQKVQKYAEVISRDGP